VNAAALRKTYGALSGAERFRLAVGADARGDDAERDHLIRTCPRVPMPVRDPEFTACFEGSTALVQTLLRCAAPFMGWLDLIEGYARAQAMRVRPAGSAPPGVPAFLRIAQTRAAQLLKALQEAFALACRAGPGLEPEVLLGAFNPELSERLHRHREIVQGAEPGGEDLAVALAGFADAWRSWAGDLAHSPRDLPPAERPASGDGG